MSTAGSPAFDSRRIRIGAVSYLNTVPLIHGLAEILPSAEMSFDHPSRLADDLAAGALDVALAPTIEFAQQFDWQLASDACIATRGPVLSVKLLFRKPPGEVKSVALDEGSRTSAVLAQILLAEIHGVRPETRPLPLGATAGDVDADAVLVIGDRAIRSSERGYIETWDLGDKWWQWTKMPFVFAAWAARPQVELATIEPALEAARDAGVREVESIALRQATAMDLPYDLVLAYLRDHLHFTLGVRERRAVHLYFTKAAQLDLIPFEFHCPFFV